MRRLPPVSCHRNKKEARVDSTPQGTAPLRAEAACISETDLPLDVFPNSIQDLILNLARYENFNVEYTACIILSAVATAIGNSCRIRIKGEWKTSPSVYMMLVGRPGLGKTPPLGFIYKPIREHDDRMYERYNDEWDEYEKAAAVPGNRRGGGEPKDCSLQKKPQLVTTVISDFTPEAMMNTHRHNPRGIALVVDEILALFNSVKRYNNRNNLIEDLLTAYSGQPLKVIRKSEARPILIKNPCVNIIGSIQTNLLSEIFRTEFIANGLLDRFLFVYPKDRRISGWKRNDCNVPKPEMVGQWRSVMDKILSIPYQSDDKGNAVSPLVLNMADDAEEYFYDWYNSIIEEVNAIEDDAEVESRKMKLNGNAARLSLVFQVLKWATNEGDMKQIDLGSVQAAIRMIDYYENTYQRIQELIVANNIGDTKEAWLSLLGETFTTGDAIVAGKKVELSRRSVYYALKQLCRQQNPVLEKSSHGTYRKINEKN
ncbi:DUF3987 domain-containing protein [Bacteroides hominis]|uniref:DUF3987 domain-containing protein n=1 Tax=Bacteroides hominis TaxID=2763023 RepID=UPI00164AA839|nr:DUF3987 domain-containing protein [Bacteroides hominis (ex Liu et al. 2022)]